MSGNTTTSEVKGASTIGAAAGLWGLSGSKWALILLILTITVFSVVISVRYYKTRLLKKS